MLSTLPKHKLAAILTADAVGCSRLRADDQAATVHTLGACRQAHPDPR